MAPTYAVESPDWVNEIVASLWPNIVGKINTYLHDEAVPETNVALRTNNLDRLVTLQVLDFALGDESPKLGKVEAVGRKGKYLALVADVSFCSDVKMSMYAMGTVIGIKSVGFKGDLVIRTTGLMSEFPVIGGVLVYFRTPPVVIMDFAEYVSLAGMEPIIQKAISFVLSQYIVAPNAIMVPVADVWASPCCAKIQPLDAENSMKEKKCSFGEALQCLAPPAKPCVHKSVEWVNDSLKVLWPRASKAMEKACSGMLEPAVNEALGAGLLRAFGSVKVTKFNFGSTAPLLSNPRIVRLVSTSGEPGLEVSFDIEFRSGIEVALRALSAEVGVRCASCKGELVIRLPTSGLRGMLIGFRQLPTMDWRFVAELTEILGIGRALQSAIGSAIAQQVVLPHVIAISLQDALWEFDDEAISSLVQSIPVPCTMALPPAVRMPTKMCI